MTTGPWTEAETAMLRSHAARGESLGMAAKALGRSRSACCAKAHREGLYFAGNQGMRHTSRRQPSAPHTLNPDWSRA